MAGGSSPTTRCRAAAPPASARSWSPWAVALVAIAIAVAATSAELAERSRAPAARHHALRRHASGRHDHRRIENRTLIAMSPDGRHLAFVATTEGRQQIWVRSVRIGSPPDRWTEPTMPYRRSGRPTAASSAFFSPGTGELKKIDASGGPARTICAPRNSKVWRRGARTAPSSLLSWAGGHLSRVGRRRHAGARHDAGQDAARAESLLAGIPARRPALPVHGDVARREWRSAKRRPSTSRHSIRPDRKRVDPGAFQDGVRAAGLSPVRSGRRAAGAAVRRGASSCVGEAGQDCRRCRLLPDDRHRGLHACPRMASLPTTAAGDAFHLVWFDRQWKRDGTGWPMQSYGTMRISPRRTACRRRRPRSAQRDGDIWIYDTVRGAPSPVDDRSRQREPARLVARWTPHPVPSRTLGRTDPVHQVARRRRRRTGRSRGITPERFTLAPRTGRPTVDGSPTSAILLKPSETCGSCRSAATRTPRPLADHPVR